MRVVLATAVLAAVLQRASSETFEYVIIGGGTCGLLLANRLSADPSVTVAVIEPGNDVRNNPNVTIIPDWTKSQNSAIDWQYQSVPQPAAGNRTLTYHAGKAIGGTSTINGKYTLHVKGPWGADCVPQSGMTYIRGDSAEFDAWEALGNHGWNWATVFSYSKAAENFRAPAASQVAGGATFDPQFHGRGGLLDVSFLPDLDTSSFFNTTRYTWDALGYPKIQDVNGGSVRGFSVWPSTVDYDANTREDSARTYYWPVAARPNLHLIQGTARKLFWDESSYSESGKGKVRAKGVEYLDAGGDLQIVEAGREVIISAGSLRTPLILELSGVGNPSLLNNLGIEIKIELPGVGENLQDQLNQQLTYSSKLYVTGSAPYATFMTAHDIFGSNMSAAATQTKALLHQWAAQIASRENNGVDVKAIEKVLAIQHDLIFNKNVTIGEVITSAHGSNLISVFWALLPFSRGSVHLTSSSESDANSPKIDPGFLEINFDLEMQIAVGKLTQKYFSTSPIKHSVVANLAPGTSVLPIPASDDQWTSFVKEDFTSNSHPIGTASMMARELGGVVDPKLMLYGAANVRVVDASILPLQVSGHLTSTLYAVAERAAEMIIGGRSNALQKDGHLVTSLLWNDESN